MPPGRPCGRNRKPRAAEGLDGAAEAAGGWPGRRRLVVEVGDVGEMGRVDREIGLGLGPSESSSGVVVCSGGVLGRVERAEPHARLLPGVSDLGRVATPWPLPHPSKVNFLFYPEPVRRRGCSRCGCGDCSRFPHLRRTELKVEGTRRKVEKSKSLKEGERERGEEKRMYGYGEEGVGRNGCMCC